MITLQDRERAFEAKFAHDHETQFRLLARRDKLFARWLADELALQPPERDALTADILHLPGGPAHDRYMLGFARSRFADHGRHLLDALITSALTRCDVEAQQSMLQAPFTHDA